VTSEVCVVGAGPAGTVCAARLAALGHEVTLVERRCFPRPHVGESLSPAIWPLLDSLGVSDRVAAAGFTRVAAARVRWRDGNEERVRIDGGLTVDRAAFDALLLDHARAAGVCVHAPAAVRAPVRTGGGWELPPAAGGLHTRFLVDASGRRRLLGGRRTPTAARTLALHAEWGRGPAPDGAQTRIDALADGWLWGARLPGGGFRAMAFADPETLVAEGRDRSRLLRRMLGASPLFAELAGAATVDGRVHACDATSYSTAAPVDASSIRVGEAAFAIDPLSSCGVQTAIQTGLAAAVTVHSILTVNLDTNAAVEYYGDHQRHAVAHHTATAAALYAEHRAHAGDPFWRRRSALGSAAPAPRAVRSAPPLRELLALPVRLPPAARLVDAACLVGDRVERRRALAHPALDRPVAFLGGSELAPLLDGLPAAPSLAHAVSAWDRSLPRGRALELAAWLHGRGLIEAG
jgi:flavin-dependent dehydrogenase